jgi:transcriptional regulator with PAS, ATPase and Fis domain
MSDRSSKPFIDVHCGAIPEGLIESELFGYAPNSGIANAEKSGKPGKFELANKGTILLDEVGTMNGLVQVKLLRVLQERVVARLSAKENTPIDVKVIAATNKNLDVEVKENRFQPDLLNRLEGFVITIPPLHDRKEDVERLFDFFLEIETKQIDGAIWPKEVDLEVYQELLNRNWEKGNVRSLEALVKRVASDRRYSLHIGVTDIPREVREEGGDEEPGNPGSTLPKKNGAESARVESNDEVIISFEEMELEKLFDILKNIKVPQALSKIKGKLTALNTAYGSLVKRFLEVALEETKDDDNQIVPTTAVKKLLDKSDMTAVKAAGYLWGIRDFIGSDYGDYPNVRKAMGWAEQRVKKQRGNKTKKSVDED